jgi:hypothetical protein
MPGPEAAALLQDRGKHNGDPRRHGQEMDGSGQTQGVTAVKELSARNVSVSW